MACLRLCHESNSAQVARIAIVSLVLSLNVSAQDITSNLQGRWRLDESTGTSAADTSPNSNHGTLSGFNFNSSSTSPGQVGDALDFDGGNDYISIPNHATLQLTSALTIAAWIKLDSFGTGTEVDVILRKGEDNPNNYQFGIADGRVALYLDDSDGNGFRGDTVLSAGQWYHVAATWDGSEVRIYLNGTLDHGTPYSRTGVIATDTRPLYLGGRAGADLSDGVIDDVRLYSRALTAAEIDYLCSVLGHWRFDEATGVAISDASAQEYDAAFATGTPTWVSGVRDGALQFDGTNDAATAASFAPPATGSVAFWFRSDSLPAGTERMLGCGGNWEIRVEPSGELYFDLGGEANGTQFHTDAGVAGAGKWRHIVALFNASTDTFSLYLDGELVRTGTINLTPQSSAVLSMGARTGSSERFNGALDDLRIINREISSADVAEIYGLVGRWKMDEGSGVTAADSSGKGNDATLSGATWTTDCSGNAGLAFDGAGDTAATDASFDPPEKGAVALWFRSAGPVASRQRPWGLGGDFEMWLDTDGLLSCDVSTDGYQGGFITDKRIDEKNLWHHLVAQYDSSDDSYAIYLDGELHKSGISTYNIQKQAAGILTFGTRTGNTQYWEGALRDFRVYNRWLLDEEIVTLSAMAGRWQLDEPSGLVATDATVVANDGTYHGPTLGINSVYAPENGTAVSFDGTNDYVEIPHDDSMLADQGTVAFWCRTTQAGATQGLFSKDSWNYDTGGHLRIRLHNGKVAARLESTSQSFEIESAPAAVVRWTHIAFTWGVSGMNLYLNGRQVASDLTYTGGLGPSSGDVGNFEPIVLGADSETSGNLVATPLQDYFAGAMDDVRFYARALCGEEVYRVYRGGRPPGVRIIQWAEVR